MGDSSRSGWAFGLYETRFEPGWLPAGFLPDFRWSQPDQDGLTLKRQLPHGGERIDIQLAPRGGRVLGLRAPRRPSWKPFPSGTALLVWAWAPGAPARVEVWNRKDARDIAERVAASLRISVPEPVAYSLAVRQPAGFSVKLAGVHYRPDGTYTSNVLFGTDDPEKDRDVLLYPTDDPITPNTAVGGRPARIFTQDHYASVEVQFAHAVADVVSHDPDQPAAELRADCLAIAATVRMVGDPTDPTTWRTPPVYR